jgi:hypothetical protein
MGNKERDRGLWDRDADLAAWSASSFPRMPIWAFAQTNWIMSPLKVMLWICLKVATEWRFVEFGLVSSDSEDRLSEIMYAREHFWWSTHSQALAIASCSAWKTEQA